MARFYYLLISLSIKILRDKIEERDGFANVTTRPKGDHL